MRFAFIDEHRGTFPVELMCEVPGVTRSGYYARRSRPESPRAQRQAELVQAVEVVHRESRGTYGSPRVNKALEARGQGCSVNTVAKLMRLTGVRARSARRFAVRTTDSRPDEPVAPNLLQREFCPERPDAVRAGDITYIPTAEGWLWRGAQLLLTRQIPLHRFCVFVALRLRKVELVSNVVDGVRFRRRPSPRSRRRTWSPRSRPEGGLIRSRHANSSMRSPSA